MWFALLILIFYALWWPHSHFTLRLWQLHQIRQSVWWAGHMIRHSAGNHHIIPVSQEPCYNISSWFCFWILLSMNVTSDDLTAKLYGSMKERGNVSLVLMDQFWIWFYFSVLFNIIKFPNDPCQASQEEEGICYTHSQCDERGGVQVAPCAAGFGICCVCEF